MQFFAICAAAILVTYVVATIIIRASGHPKGLSTLFFTEMWERFSYYGMRAILMLFMVGSVESGGLGFDPAKAGPIYAMYTSMVYLATVPGGWLADNFLGQRRSLFWGGVIIMTGHILLAMHGLSFFYAGLAFVVVGTGLLKPNISVIVGQLYTPEDNRRDAGFSIFYMGINLGAFGAPLACGYLAQDPGFKLTLEGWGIDPANAWHWGFGAAAVGMFLGLVQYVLTHRQLGNAGLLPSPPKDAAHAAARKRTLSIGIGSIAVALLAIGALAAARPDLMTRTNIDRGFTVLLFGTVVAFFSKLFLAGDWTRNERARLVTIFVLFCGAAVFWGIFEQAGSTLTLFADKSTDNSIFGKEFPSSWWQSMNAVLIILLAPLFAWLWIRLGKRDPSYPTKFAVGLLFAGLGFALLIGGAVLAKGGVRVSPMWLFGVYLLHTIGELCLSPVGLSSMTKLAPVRVVSLMMGVWFLAASVGNFIGGTVSGYYEHFELPTLFGVIAASGGVMSLIMFALVGPMKRMMERSTDPAPIGSGH
jgi:POT family proton-dependent oligopeptide transporter